MRRIISFILIVCLLHTQTYHANEGGDAIEQPSSTVWERSLSKVAFWRSTESQQTKDIMHLESGGVTSDAQSAITLSDLATSLKQQVSELKERITAFINTPMGFTVVFLAGTVLVLYSIYVFIVGLSAWLEGIPFDVSSKMLTTSSLRTYQPLDVCQNFLDSDEKELERTRWYSHYEHASGYNGVSFEDALPQWVNNATNLVAMLSSLVLAERSIGRPEFISSDKFERDFKNLIFTYGSKIPDSYSCTFKLGERDHLDTITGCQVDFQKEFYGAPVQIPEAADAMIQFREANPKNLPRAPAHLAVRLSINRNHLNTQRYPQLDYSPDHAHIDDVFRMSTQRRLMQLSNQLTLPEAVTDRISNNLQVMTQLNDMLSKLRLWESVSHADVLAFTALARSVFNANQIALTSDIGCDLEFANGMFNILSCFPGVARDIPGGALVPNDAQVWFVRTAGNGVNYIQAFANKAPVAEAMATWLKQSTDAMENLWGVADTLHHRVCNGTSDDQIELLRKAAQRELMDHQAALSSDVGCDLRFNDVGVEEILCHAGTAPQPKVDGCDLDSNVPVRWEGKLWLQPHALNTEWLDKVIVAASPVWQESRTQMRPYSPSLRLTDSGRLSDELTFSGSRSPSNEMSQRVTGTGSGTDTDSNSDSLSAEMSDELTLSGSGSPSNATMPYSPTFPNANTTSNGITELYYVATVDNAGTFDWGSEVRRVFVNSTHILNDTLFLANTTFGDAYPLYGLTVDTQHQKIYWTTFNGTNNQYKNIYVADIASNPTRLNNMHILYATSTYAYSLYLSKTTGRIFGTTSDGGGNIYMGQVNTTNPTNITNVTSQPMIPNILSQSGLYFDPHTQSLLWTRYEGSTDRYFICKSTLNLQTEQLVNTTVLLNESSPIRSVSYDAKNHRILFNLWNLSISAYRPYVAPFRFDNPMPLTHITETSYIPLYGFSVVND